jgi:hypothetical protein
VGGKMKKKNEFIGIERALDLPFGFLSDKKNLKLPETKALLKIIKAFPWMINVADHNFDKKVVKREIIHAAVDAGLLEEEMWR